VFVEIEDLTAITRLCFIQRVLRYREDEAQERDALLSMIENLSTNSCYARSIFDIRVIAAGEIVNRKFLRALFSIFVYNPLQDLVYVFCIFADQIDQASVLISLSMSCARYTHIIAGRTPWQVREIRKNPCLNLPSVE